MYGKTGARGGGKSVSRMTQFRRKDGEGRRKKEEVRSAVRPAGGRSAGGWSTLKTMKTASRTLKGGREAEGERERKPLGPVGGHKNGVSAFLCPFSMRMKGPLSRVVFNLFRVVFLSAEALAQASDKPEFVFRGLPGRGCQIRVSGDEWRGWKERMMKREDG